MLALPRRPGLGRVRVHRAHPWRVAFSMTLGMNGGETLPTIQQGRADGGLTAMVAVWLRSFSAPGASPATAPKTRWRYELMQAGTFVGSELPRYKSHKEVHALKIARIKQHPDGSWSFEAEEPGFAPISLAQDYMDRHKPEVGGYYVVYADGYKSWSPAGAFEAGYTRV